MTNITEVVEYYYPNTIRRLALTREALPSGIPFMGYFVELFDGANLPDEADIAAKAVEYEAMAKSTSLKSFLAAYRYAIQNGGTVVSGVPVKTDVESRSALLTVWIVANANPAYIVNWKAANGSFVDLDATRIIAVGNGVLGFVQKCFDSEKSVAANITKYTTEAEVIAAFNQAMTS